MTISNFSSKLLVFFLVPLYTGVLTTEEYGTYDIIVSTISLLLPILTVNIVDGVMRFSMDEKESKIEVASIGFVFTLLGCILFWLLIVINYYFQIFPLTNGLETLIIGYMFANAFLHFLTQLAKGLEKVFDMGIAGIFGTVTAVILNVYFLVYLKLGFKGFFLASISSSAIQIMYYTIRLKLWSLIKPFIITNRLTKEIIFYSAPLILTVLGWWINSAADKYIVTFFCGIASNGLLAISYKIPTIINTIQTIFLQAWQISAIKEYQNGDNFYIQMFEYYNLLMCLSCSGLIILTRPIATFLYAKDFYTAWQYVPLLLVCGVLNGAAGFIGPILSARKDSKTLAKSAIYASICNVILNILLTYLIGIQGAIIATVLSSYVLYVTRKIVIGKMIESDIYNSIMIVWLLLIVQCFAEIYLQNYFIESAIMFLICCLLRKSLIKCLTILKARLINLNR